MLICRGCLAPLSQNTLYSFSWPMVKELYTKCTYLEVPKDQYPQQICQQCYTRCREWSTFRTMCMESEERLRNDTVFNTGVNVTIKEEQPDSEDSHDDGELEAGELLPTLDIFDDIPDNVLAAGSGRNRFQCPTCYKCLPSDWKLKRHMNVHKRVLKAGSNHIRRIRPRTYSCPECGKAFESNYKLNRHIAIHTREPKAGAPSTRQTQSQSQSRKPPDMVCAECGEAFTDAKAYQTHRKTHQGQNREDDPGEEDDDGDEDEEEEEGETSQSDDLSSHPLLSNLLDGDDRFGVTNTPDLMCVAVMGALADDRSDGQDNNELDWAAVGAKEEPAEEDEDADSSQEESQAANPERKKFNPKFKGKYQCKICQKTCTSNWKLSRHMGVHDREKIYPPSLVEFLEVSLDEPEGDEGSNAEDQVKECAVTKDGKVAKHWCRTCRKVFPSKWKLNRHLNVHKAERR